MGLIPSFCRALIMLHQKMGIRGPLLTLGNQDIWASHDELKSFFDELGCPYAEAAVRPHTSQLFSHRPEAKNFVHASTFFEMLGVEEYYDLDKFELDSPRILHDLNVPIPDDLHGRFNLVLDSGTIEHIFDVRQVMENIVRLCGESGWVVHISPSSNYIDHGFYSFSPCFFYDFYEANGFDEFTCYLLQVNPENVYEPSPYFEYSYGMDLSSLIEPGRQILVFFAAKKVRPAAQFAVPTQGIYQSMPRTVPPANSTVLAAGQGADSLIERLVPAIALPYLKPVRPLLGAVRRKVTRRQGAQLRRI